MGREVNGKPKRRVGSGWASLPILLLPLLAGHAIGAAATAPPLLFRCRTEGSEPVLIRVDPGRRLVQALDPGTGAVRDTVEEAPPPAELGSGIVDESSVTVTAREIVWERRMFRPQFASERHVLDRLTLAYRIEWQLAEPMSLDAALRVERGSCRRLQRLP